ncbi:MAG TPA: FG-GAP-like repeat-containing protein [Bryobacteraceae bacterium]|nr:FG-GAP-like repeat-containing protein [Bryobacteraceae bacterium]
MRSWAIFPLAGGLAAAWLLLAQSSSPVAPFATTPSILGWDGTAETIYVRQPGTGTYDSLRFGANAPFGLLSSAASLAQIVSGSVRFGMNTPAAPSGVGPASQFLALADFTGDGSPGIALAGPVGHNDSSLTVDEFSPMFLYRTAITRPFPNASSAGVIAADVNRDGKADLVVAIDQNSGPGMVQVYLNNGDGTFAAPVNYAAGVYPDGMATLDLNHDGFLDLVVASGGGSTGPGSGVYVFLGKGDGTFTAAGNFPAGSSPASVTIADFNGDGNPDLAVTSLDKTVHILLGAGNGTFTAGASFATGNSPLYVAAGDFNQDGNLDLAVTNTNDQTVSVFLGDGKGSFQAGATYIASNFPNSLIVTDFNGDGKLDIIQGLGDARGFGASSSSYNMDILLGNGDGTFQGATATPAPNANTDTTLLALGNFQGNGKIDAILSDPNKGSLFVFSGNGDGTFQPPATLSNFTGAQSAAAGDFNNDGKLDLAVAELFSGQIAVLLNSNSGLQPSGTFSSGGAQSSAIVAADFNGDRNLDLAVANTGSSGTAGNLAVFFGGGNGAFQLAKTYSAGIAPTGLATADLNGDGFPDLVVTDAGSEPSANGAVYVFLNDGKGGFQPPQMLSASNYPIFVTAGDINGDRKPDLVVGTLDNNVNFHLAIFLNQGNGTFPAGNLIDTQFGPSGAAIADFNGDGNNDLVVAHCCGDTEMTYLRGNGDGTFQPEVAFNGGGSPYAVATADLNGDGKPDLVIGDISPLAVVGLLNNALPAATTVNGASFAANQTVAPNSIATVFGTHLANGTSASSSAVTIQDSSGASQSCTLFNVFPSQINFLVPAGVAIGPATVTVHSADGVVSRGTVTIAAVAPGIFAVPTALLDGFSEVVDAQGNAGPLNYTVQANPNQPGSFLAAPVALTSASNTVYLILFGTGIRGAPQSQVSVTAGGVPLPVRYAGTQNQFPGLDQINVTVPYSLKGAGDVTITVTAAGQSANPVHVTLQ